MSIKQYSNGASPSEVSGHGANIHGNKPGLSYNFIEDRHASTSQRKNEDLIEEASLWDEDQSNARSFSFDKISNLELDAMIDKGVSSFGLSLGGDQIGSSLSGGCLNNDVKVNQSLKDIDTFGLALGSSRRPQLKRESDLILPFWNGKLTITLGLKTVHIHMDAFWPGMITEADSRLKKLPTSLSIQKYVKLEEYVKMEKVGRTLKIPLTSSIFLRIHSIYHARPMETKKRGRIFEDAITKLKHMIKAKGMHALRNCRDEMTKGVSRD
jgi:hypothetical protein